MKKRLLSLLLVMVLVIGVMPFAALADGEPAVVAQGTCGATEADNVNWVLTDDGIMTISGTGAMANYATKTPGPWHEHRLDIKDVIIENGVTSIGNYAFGISREKYENLTAVSIANTVSKIGISAFRNSSIKEVTIPDTVTEIGNNAFANIASLEKATVNGNILGESIFNTCSALKEVNLNGQIETIPYNAFTNCTALTAIVLPETVTTIDRSAFWQATALETVNIPSGVTTIAGGAFGGCTKLAMDVVLPETLTTLGNGAFQNSGIKSVVIPESITTLEGKVFNGCGSLVSVKFADTLQVIKTDAFCNCFSLKELVLPKNLTTIEDYRVFQNCDGLTTVTIYDKLTFIGNTAFDGCSKLATVNFHGTEEQWAAIEFKAGNEALTNAAVNYILFVNEKPVVKAENVKSSGKVKLTIEPVEDAVSYKIFVATAADGEFELAAETDKTTYTYNGKAGTKYYFKVQAVNEAGETSAESELVNKVQVPAQVTSLKATTKKGQVTLKWKKVTGAKKYVIYMSKNGKSGWKKIGTATKNTFVYKKGKVGAKLYFKVQALTANNKKGEFSKVVSIKVKK